ncbi:2-amino-4-hydroxy-6- hydroxymethyldihydropteridine pyrophosphokinase [Candidatus Endolissoclinum faulkneri L5]|uniref:2-amino-4-hydroxy-6-hydroxymethyldihydropteridine pyrophosphokinase n=1 Tax=Candidatus Endolissoclinum faulkneri L5 TaxID=1401328 RepID=V9TUX3_9PROT|nr:2-amino-4-hydroxy-6-hydroxymethyldihydropteridine diphosphokinase [Candidatus Endolissoclinum faulkneri]AHC73962.1 2-amino-4-hydroxy-6- hydroxymethyldihydropteridine pyrophosphokinase [Candidatus Endolissoclinum faulkneri L5]
MILIAIGANLSANGYKTPLATCEAAVVLLKQEVDIEVVGCSRWFKSDPVPMSKQPKFINGVVAINTTLSPESLLSRLHTIENAFGRVRQVRNEARQMDLDIIDFNGKIRVSSTPPILPHPRAAERAFVLLPIRDLFPNWQDPITGETVSDRIKALSSDILDICPLTT